MILDKVHIKKIKSAWEKAEIAEKVSQEKQRNLGLLISQITGVEGFVDHLQGDGMGFTPASNNDTHIPLSDLIRLAEEGEDINEELIIDHLSL